MGNVGVKYGLVGVHMLGQIQLAVHLWPGVKLGVQQSYKMVSGFHHRSAGCIVVRIFGFEMYVGFCLEEQSSSLTLERKEMYGRAELVVYLEIEKLLSGQRRWNVFLSVLAC